MTEKGEGTHDTVSLPPTYAPSETYTESPPPAYRGGQGNSGKVVQIVKLLCITAVVIALLIGLFTLSNNYLKARACTCDGAESPNNEGLLHAGFLPPSPQALVGEREVKEVEEAKNTLDRGDEAVLVAEEKQEASADEQVNQLVEEVVEAEQQLEQEVEKAVEEEEAALQDILQAQADHMKKIRLPIDLILGEPQLAGREVGCEVERKQVPIAPGIMSQTILVTCRDDEDDQDQDQDHDLPQDLPPTRRFPAGPPMSLIAPLMKILSSRPGPQPRIVPLNMIPSMPRNLVQDNPLPFSFNAKPRLTVLVPRPSPEESPMARMIPRMQQSVVRMTPRLVAGPRDAPNPMSMMLQRGPILLPRPKPRAPHRPVNLSPPRSSFMMPFNVMAAPSRPATHMELKSSPPLPAEPRNAPHSPAPPRSRSLPPPPPSHLLPLPSFPSFPHPFEPFPSHPRENEENHNNPHSNPPQAPQPPSFALHPRRAPIPPPIEREAEVILPSSSPSSPPSSPDSSSGPSPPRKHLLMVN